MSEEVPAIVEEVDLTKKRRVERPIRGKKELIGDYAGGKQAGRQKRRKTSKLNFVGVHHGRKKYDERSVVV